MNFLDFIKNVNLAAAAAWVVVWNVLCGIGIYFDGLGPIDTLPGAAMTAIAALFASTSSLLAMFSATGRRWATASYGDHRKLLPMLRLMAAIGGLLFVGSVAHAVWIATGHA